VLGPAGLRERQRGLFLVDKTWRPGKEVDFFCCVLQPYRREKDGSGGFRETLGLASDLLCDLGLVSSSLFTSNIAPL
jgi:hypothetical protein